MKRDFWKLLLLILLAGVCCHITLLGNYPFVAILFFAVYMTEFYTTAWIGFNYLFMALWLPMADLFRYGIAFLVWMVFLAIARRMQIHRAGFYKSLLAGLILTVVSLGGDFIVRESIKKDFLPPLEGMLVAGGSLFVYRAVEMFLQWKPVLGRKKEIFVTERMSGYQQAMTGLSSQLQSFLNDSVAPSFGNLFLVREELQKKICRDCQKKETCFTTDDGMVLVLEDLVQNMEQGLTLDDQVREEIQKRCEKGELFLQEAVNVFEKMELNQSWHRRLCEHRELIAGEIDAIAMAMEDCMERDVLQDEKEAWRLMQLKFRLKELGVKVGQVHLYQRKNGSLKLSMELAARYKSCITLRELLPSVNSCFMTPLVSAVGNRGIIGREKKEYIFVSQTKVDCDFGVAKMVQEGQMVSGDSFRAEQMEDGRFVMALSDGMGSGEQANRESESVVDLLMKFVQAGFSMNVALRLMNAAMVFGAEQERFSTLDVCLLDSYSGIAEIYKVGAHVSFLKHKDHVEVIDASSLPMGAGKKVDVTPNRCYMAPSDCLVMVTDGVLEYLQVEDPVETLSELIREMSVGDAASFSRKIMERMLLFTGGKVQDDMTVLTLITQER